MIVLEKLMAEAKPNIKGAVSHFHYGLGRYYKIQIYKGFDHEIYGSAVKSGDAVMFTVQQMVGSAHLKANHEIKQVVEWFVQNNQSFEIQLVEGNKYDIFVIKNKEIVKPKKSKKDPEGHVLEYVDDIPKEQSNEEAV